MTDIPDVDIDVADRDAAIKPFNGVAIPAVQIANGVAIKHNVGLYLQRVPVNPLNGYAAFDHHYAEEIGYYKIDIIPNSVYTRIKSQDHLRQIIEEPIDWEWFQNPDFVRRLFHISNHAALMQQYKPKSILDLAMLLAVIRPGKRYLIGESWDVVREKIWQKEPPERGSTFKKSHSVAYSLLVGVDARLKALEFFALVLRD